MEPAPLPTPLEPSESRPFPPRAPRRRRWLHALLFLLTVATTFVAGSVIWDGALADAISSGGSAIAAIAVGGWRYAFAVLGILTAHEFGHYVACRWHRVEATLPYFVPGIPPLGTFGAVIRIRGPIPDRAALFDIAASGPIAGFVVAIPILVAGVMTAKPAAPEATAGQWILGTPLLVELLARWLGSGTDFVAGPWFGAGWVGMLVTSMNLFPVGQLDGGHAAYAISRRLHRVLSIGTLLAVGTLVLWQTWSRGALSVYSLWFLVLLFMRDRHPRLLEETRPLSTGRRTLALLLVIIFVLAFIPLPVSTAGP